MHEKGRRRVTRQDIELVSEICSRKDSILDAIQIEAIFVISNF